MSISPAVRTAPDPHISVANHIRRVLAAASALVLAGIGLWTVKTDHMADRILTLYLTFGPAAIYVLGFFYWLPEVMGAPARKVRAPLAQRWSTFARLSGIGAALGWIVWVVAFWGKEGVPGSIGAIATLLAITLVPPILMFAGVSASEEYVAHTIGSATPDNPQSWHTPLTRAVGQLGSSITKLFKARFSLSFGSALVLASLLLNITLMSYCGEDPRKGYEIVTDKAVWVTVQQTIRDEGALTTIASQIGRGMYVLDLVIAAASLSAALMVRTRVCLFRNLAMVRVTGILAFVSVCDFTLAMARTVGMPPGIWALVLLLCTCILPPVFWMWRAQQSQHWDYTRLALMIALLPVVFFTTTIGFFTSTFSDLYGLASFLFGMQLLWWGSIQAHWESRRNSFEVRS